MIRNKASFYGEVLSTPRPTLKLEDHSLSAVHDCLFNIFAAILEAFVPSVTWWRAMPLWQGPIYHGFYSCSPLENKATKMCPCLTWKSGLALRHQPPPLQLVCSTSRLLWQSCCVSTVAVLCWTQSKTWQCWRWPICTPCLAVDTEKLRHASCTGKRLLATFHTNIL
jgi:hypothetical protein